MVSLQMGVNIEMQKHALKVQSPLKTKFNLMIAGEVKHLMYRLKNEGKLDKFEEVLAFKGIICEKKDRENICLEGSLSDKDKTTFQ